MSESQFSLFCRRLQVLHPEVLVKEYLSDLQETVKILKPFEERLPEQLDKFMEQENTVSSLVILLVKLSINETEFDAVGYMRKFVENFNVKVVQCAKYYFYELVHVFAKQVIEKPDMALQGIKIVSDAIEKIRKNKNQLTPIHSDLFMLCLKSKHFHLVSKNYIYEDIFEIETGAEEMSLPDTPQQHNLNSKYVLAYYYYAGMICIALKDYEKALFYFEVCISTPASCLSKIVIEAYKKHILVCLLKHGFLKFHTSYVNDTQLVALDEVKPYLELIKAYPESRRAFETAMDSGRAQFQIDQNYGLVKRARHSLFKRKIKELMMVFSTLNIEDLHRYDCVPPDAEIKQFLFQMALDPEINMQIDEKRNIVLFNTRPESTPTQEMYEKLLDEIEEALTLNSQVQAMHTELSLNPEYIRLAEAGGNGGSAGSNGTPGDGADCCDLVESNQGDHYCIPN